MTHDEIQEIPAGEVMDMLIAAHVIGLDVSGEAVASYSDSVALAWEVADVLINRHNLIVRVTVNSGMAFCELSQRGRGLAYVAYAKSFPLAICRAALMAVLK